jgi:thiol-disulfide isomerase/thioredoxin
MIQVNIFGTTPPCARCKEMERRANNVAAKYSDRVAVAKFDALSAEGDKYGIMSTPTLVINDRVVAVGKLLSEEEIEKYIVKELEVRS